MNSMMSFGKFPISPLRGRGRPKLVADTDQRQRIVAEAFELFCDRGYGGMNMDDVAARCRISKKTLYRLFPGKRELAGAIIDAHREIMVDIRPDYDSLPLTEALERIFLVDIDEQQNRSRIAFIRAVTVDSVPFPELRELVEARGRDHTHALVTAWLERQRALGRVATEDPATAARVLMEIAFGAISAAAGRDWEWKAFPQWREYVRRAFDLVVKGLEPRPDR